MMHKETDKTRIREFLDLLGNERYDLRKYTRPVLVYKVEDKTVFYSIWEDDLLNRFGLSNVDGWDIKRIRSSALTGLLVSTKMNFLQN